MDNACNFPHNYNLNFKNLNFPETDKKWTKANNSTNNIHNSGKSLQLLLEPNMQVKEKFGDFWHVIVEHI